jgi:hypothetical protein
MTIEAMKLALEALENSIDLVEGDYANAVNLYGKYPSRAKRLIGMETMRDDHRKAITAVREALEKAELHKLASDSLTEGLRLDDWNKIGCVNHDCDRCKALAEQPAQHECRCNQGQVCHVCDPIHAAKFG